MEGSVDVLHVELLISLPCDYHDLGFKSICIFLTQKWVDPINTIIGENYIVCGVSCLIKKN